jgi:hypothetical protein
MKRPGRKCEHVSDEGKQCRAWARRDSEPPRCALHALTPEQRTLRSQLAASASALKRRGDAEPEGGSGLDLGLNLEDIVRVVTPALEATFEHDGRPDWGARLCAAGVLVAAFPRQYRQTPERVRELLDRILPANVRNAEQIEAEKVYRAMRREWDELPAWSELRGLYVKPYPAYMVAPFEDAAAVQRERPADVPLEQAPVLRLPNGRVALKRTNDLPLLLDVAEDEGGYVRAPHVIP